MGSKQNDHDNESVVSSDIGDLSLSTALKSERSGETTDDTLAKTESATTMAETKAVIRSKRLVLLLLALAAVAASALTYYFVKKQETESYQNQVRISTP